MMNEINEMSYPEMKQKLVELYGKDVSFLKGVTALYLRVKMLEQQIEELQKEEYSGADIISEFIRITALK